MAPAAAWAHLDLRGFWFMPALWQYISMLPVCFRLLYTLAPSSYRFILESISRFVLTTYTLHLHLQTFLSKVTYIALKVYILLVHKCKWIYKCITITWQCYLNIIYILLLFINILIWLFLYSQFEFEFIWFCNFY